MELSIIITIIGMLLTFMVNISIVAYVFGKQVQSGAGLKESIKAAVKAAAEAAQLVSRIEEKNHAQMLDLSSRLARIGGIISKDYNSKGVAWDK